MKTMTDTDEQDIVWYPVLDDTIGGYAISNVRLPVSEHDWTKGHMLIGSFLRESTARHICELHNATLHN